MSTGRNDVAVVLKRIKAVFKEEKRLAMKMSREGGKEFHRGRADGYNDAMASAGTPRSRRRRRRSPKSSSRSGKRRRSRPPSSRARTLPRPAKRSTRTPGRTRSSRRPSRKDRRRRPGSAVNDQLPIAWQPKPLSRASDPSTSREAAAGASAKAACDRERCLRAVREHPGSTSHEIARYAGLDRHAAARRLPELRDVTAEVENGPARKCSVSGRMGITWVPRRQGVIGGVA